MDQSAHTKHESIQVTIYPADVEYGRPNSCQWCAFALALRRQLKANWVSVGTTNAFVIREGSDPFSDEVEIYDLSSKAQQWIRDFDCGQKVHVAITFTLRRHVSDCDDEQPDLRRLA